MNHRHRKILHALYAHPVSANIPVKGIEAMLGEIGAEVSASGHGRLNIRLNDHQITLPHHGTDLSPHDVQQLRRFLTDQGIDPATQYPL